MPIFAYHAPFSACLWIHFGFALVFIINPILIFTLHRFHWNFLLFHVVFLLLNLVAHGLFLSRNLDIAVLKVCCDVIQISLVDIRTKLIQDFSHLSKLLDIFLQLVNRVLLIDHLIFALMIQILNESIQESVAVVLVSHERTYLLHVDFECGKIGGASITLERFEELLGHILWPDLVGWYREFDIIQTKFSLPFCLIYLFLRLFELILLFDDQRCLGDLVECVVRPSVVQQDGGFLEYTEFLGEVIAFTVVPLVSLVHLIFVHLGEALFG